MDNNDKLVEVSDQVVRINFILGTKCRATVHVRSLSNTSTVAFKVQTSSPDKFLVNPPSGLIPPLTQSTFQIILKPQPQLPTSFPRSPQDRFLIQTARVEPANSVNSAGSTQLTRPVQVDSPNLVNSLNSVNSAGSAQLTRPVQVDSVKLVNSSNSVNSGGLTQLTRQVRVDQPNLVKHSKSVNSGELTQLTQLTFSDKVTKWTYEVKLKVAYVGPFLLRHAVNNGDCKAVKDMVKFHKTLLSELTSREAESLYRVANRLDNNKMVGLLLRAGLKVEGVSRSLYLYDVKDSKGWTELHVAVAFDKTDEVTRLVKMGGCYGGLECKDREGRTALFLAASKGYERCVRVLAGAGGNVDAKRIDGCTALFKAVVKGERRMVKVLIELGADPSIVVDGRHRTAVDVARDEGYNEIVETLERGEDVLNAARRGDLVGLEYMLERDAGVDFRDQYGLTAIHMAAIKGYKDVVMLLVEFGSDLECTDAEGQTPLHMAVVGGCKDTVEVLINRGANLNAKCNRGATPLQVAQTMGYETITQFLLLNQPIS